MHMQLNTKCCASTKMYATNAFTSLEFAGILSSLHSRCSVFATVSRLTDIWINAKQISRFTKIISFKTSFCLISLISYEILLDEEMTNSKIWGLLLKDRIFSHREQVLYFKDTYSLPLGWGGPSWVHNINSPDMGGSHQRLVLYLSDYEGIITVWSLFRWGQKGEKWI